MSTIILDELDKHANHLVTRGVREARISVDTIMEEIMESSTKSSNDILRILYLRMNISYLNNARQRSWILCNTKCVFLDAEEEVDHQKIKT